MRSESVPSTDVLPVCILGGYLGAGKTSLINRLLRDAQSAGPERRLAVLVNDFGAINIDAGLIVQASAELPNLGAAKVLGLAGGCICCSFGADLVGALRDLLAFNQGAAGRGEPPFEQVLIEASGVGIPSAIAQTARLLPEVRVHSTVAVVDASQILVQLDDPYLGDTVTAQLRDADLILANQLDRLPHADQADGAQAWSARFAARCEQAAIDAAVLPVVLGAPPELADALQPMRDMPLGWVLDRPPIGLPQPAESEAAPDIGTGAGRRSRWARRGLRPARRDSASAQRVWHSFVWQPAGPVDRQALLQVLADPALGLLRAKGWLQFVPSDGTAADTLLVQAAGGRVDLWPSLAPASQAADAAKLAADGPPLGPALVLITLAELCDLALFEHRYQQTRQRTVTAQQPSP